MERNDYLIRKKIVKYMLTGVMTTVALQLGNVVDAMIVGNLIGSLGNGAITAGTPYVYVLQAAAILLGSGGAVTMAILLGKRDLENAGRVMGFSMVISILYPLIFVCLSPVLIPAFLNLCGASGELLSMIKDMITVYTFGMPVLSFAITMAYLMNIDNHPTLSAVMHITANVVNLISDFLLLKLTPLGMKGAALSTVLGYLVAGLIFIPIYFKSSNRMVKIDFTKIFRGNKYILVTCKNGLPNLVNLIMTVISISLINSVVLKSLGDDYFSAYSVINNTQLIVQMFLNGVTSVIASVAGVLYGEKDFYGMRRVLKRVLGAVAVVCAALMLLFIIAPKLLAKLYGFDNETIMPELLLGLRVFSLSFLFYAFNAMAQNYYRTIGQTMLSSISIALQMIVIKIPLMLLGLKIHGFIGLFVTLIFSEIIAFLILNAVRLILQLAGKVPKKGFMAIPVKNSGNICDFTISGKDGSALDVTEKVIAYCREENLPSETALQLGVAVEELILNIEDHGYKDKKSKYIDVCLSKNGDRYYLRLRDDGIPFDPTSYESKEEHDEDEITGLELIRKLALKITYMRVLNLNNTIIEIEKGAIGGKAND